MVKIDLKHFKSWRIRYAYVCRSVQMRRLQGWRKDGLHVHLPERPDDPRSSGNEGVQPGTRRLLGMLFLREDLPPGRHHRSSLRDFAPMGGTCIPMRSADSIMWTVQFRNGSVKRFKFPIRTTPEGSIKPFEGKPEGANLDDELLFTEEKLATPIEVLGKKFEVTEADKVFTAMEPGR